MGFWDPIPQLTDQPNSAGLFFIPLLFIIFVDTTNQTQNNSMFKGQPKGLYALALANTGERFGYYTMLAIFLLFLQAKFG